MRKRHDARSGRRWFGHLVGVLVLWEGAASGQTPDATLFGRVADPGGGAIAGARIIATHVNTGLRRSTTSDSKGDYALQSIPRGMYTLELEATGFHGVREQGIELAVGARERKDITLSPVSPAEQAGIGGIPEVLPSGPSLPPDAVASVSIVVDENQILQLPLADRNIYSLFLLQPGVTSQGAVARRGLTFSVHGQRVSGSNYMLDGVDNNNALLTGPQTATSAAAIQEFRMTRNSFSAEAGRATGFVAHVVGRTGANALHGQGFEFLANDKLNANTFQNNARGTRRQASGHNQFGYGVGGAIRANRAFFFSALEISRLRDRFPQTLRVPSPAFLGALPPDSPARRLLADFPPLPPTGAGPNPDIGIARHEFGESLNSLFTTQRLDHHFSNLSDRVALRYTLAAMRQSEGIGQSWGYPTLKPTDEFRDHNVLLGWTHSFDAGQVNQFRVGWSRDRLQMPRPHPELPILQSLDGTRLPGNWRQLDRRENNNVLQISDGFSMRRGRSSLTVGWEFRRNYSNGVRLGLERDVIGLAGYYPHGLYTFADLRAFARGQPLSLLISVDRFSPSVLRTPDLYRQYRSNDYAAFLQNDVRIAPRVSLNLGVRWEYFGVPHSGDQSQDVNFYFGPGATIEERLANGVLRAVTENPGDLRGRLYRGDWMGFAPSAGIAWDVFGRGRTVLRAGYGVALDRIFDSARDLRFNNQQLARCVAPLGCTPRLAVPAAEMLLFVAQRLDPAPVVQLDENLRTPYAQNWYAGIQQSITAATLFEMGHAGSVGRRLISRDLVNRSVPGVLAAINPAILDNTFLSNAGNSNYLSLEVSLRRRFSRGLQFQISYTYSHAIDNQSDILEGYRMGSEPMAVTLATFTRQFDARVDRGNANFDQRHNLIFNGIWDLPSARTSGWWGKWLLSGWTASLIGGHRSGFPVTVLGSDTARDGLGLWNNRADYIGPGVGFSPAVSAPGTVQWLDRNEFAPAVGHVGSLGRGALRGPGFWSYDLALLRQFPAAEGRFKIQWRVEFYNALNHANLSVPVATLSDPNFGRAYYGIAGPATRFGELPLDSAARRIQLGVTVRF